MWANMGRDCSGLLLPRVGGPSSVLRPSAPRRRLPAMGSMGEHVPLVGLIYIVSFLDLFSVSMVITVLPSYLRESVGLSATMAGLISSLYGVVQFFSSPAAGGSGDRLGYGRVLLRCLVLCVPAYALLGLPSALAVAASRLTAGLFKHTQNLCRTAVAAYAKEEEKIAAYGRLNAIGNVGFMLGPALAGWLVGQWGYNAVFMACSLSFAVNAVFVFATFPMNGAPKKEADSDAPTGIMAGLKQINWTAQWDIMLLRFLMSLTALLYRNGFNWLLKDKFGLGAESVGYLTSYQGTAAFLSSFFANVVTGLYEKRTTCLIHVIALLLVSYLGFINSVFFATYAAFLIPFVVATSLMRVLILDLTIDRCSKEERGLMVGVSASVVSVSRAVSPAVSGVLHDVHYNSATWLGLGLSAVALLVAVFVTPKNQIRHVHPHRNGRVPE